MDRKPSFYDKFIDLFESKKIRLFLIELDEIHTQFSIGIISGLCNFKQNRYGLARYNFGSLLATILAATNLYRIRQKVIKYSLVLTKSKNPVYLLPVN